METANGTAISYRCVRLLVHRSTSNEGKRYVESYQDLAASYKQAVIFRCPDGLQQLFPLDDKSVASRRISEVHAVKISSAAVAAKNTNIKEVSIIMDIPVGERLDQFPGEREGANTSE